MPDHCRDRAIPERKHQADRVPHDVAEAERAQIAIIAAIPTDGTPVAALVGSNDMKPRIGKRHHDLAPAVCELRKPMQQKETGPVSGFVACLQHVHRQTVDPVHKARAHAGGQRGFVEGD